MLHTTENQLKDMLVDVEGADLKTDYAIRKNQQSLYTVADIEDGKFRRLFNRHRRAYRLFN